jgi:hypothetical protein
MRRFITVATVVFALVAFGSMALAQGAKASDKKKDEKTVTKVEKTEPLAATGKVDKLDDSGKKFTLKTKDGDKEFTLAKDAKITAGTKTEKAEAMKGKDVKVTYTVVDGKSVASKVTIASDQKDEKKDGKKDEKKK